MRYRLRKLLLLQTLVLVVPILLSAVASVLSALGIVGFHYPRPIDNDALRSPVNVRYVDTTRLVLEDGREFEFLDEIHLRAVMAGQYCNRVDLELQPDGAYTVYGQQRMPLPCTRWQEMIRIPLLPENVPLNARLPAGTVRLISKAK
jgi:hypothetical protein